MSHLAKLQCPPSLPGGVASLWGLAGGLGGGTSPASMGIASRGSCWKERQQQRSSGRAELLHAGSGALSLPRGSRLSPGQQQLRSPARHDSSSRSVDPGSRRPGDSADRRRVPSGSGAAGNTQQAGRRTAVAGWFSVGSEVLQSCGSVSFSGRIAIFLLQLSFRCDDLMVVAVVQHSRTRLLTYWTRDNTKFILLYPGGGPCWAALSTVSKLMVLPSQTLY